MAKKSGGKSKGGKSSSGGPSAMMWMAAVGGCVAFFAALSILNSRGKPSGFPVPPDTRPRGCSAQSSGHNLSSVSMVIPYLNEKIEHLLGTTNSILHYTPDHLLEEILFISDGNSPFAVHKAELEGLSPKIRVIELPKREGLIRAKMVGVRAAKAEVLVFMEPHCIVNRNWLEPLLLRVKSHPGTLAQPVLDHIPWHDFNQYQKTDMGHWRFEWNLNLIFTDPGRRIAGSSGPEPVRTPATSGGIFAIRRDFWLKLGLYDEGMHQWGGDHVEATMKVWRCGGLIELVPCSRIGHLFRSPEQRPYDVDTNLVVNNYKRLAHVWFDDHLESFYKVKPEARGMDLGDVSKQIAQRQELGCKSMDWYLKNVDVEMGWEESHICIPGCTSHPHCCKNGAQAPPGHSTLDKEIPVSQYDKFKTEANPSHDEL